MRHMKRGRHLGRTSSHRRAMLRNMATSLFVHGRIITTPEKAKEARPFAERLITLAKRGDLAAKRRAIRLLHDPKTVTDLFESLGPRYKERPGGYTRILHLEKRRVGDGARLALFELVEEEIRVRKGGKARRPAPVAVETPAATEAAESSAAEAPQEEAAAPASADAEAPAGNAPASEDAAKDA